MSMLLLFCLLLFCVLTFQPFFMFSFNIFFKLKFLNSLDICFVFCRPSEDDIKVLKKELIRSQQLMDSITQEREDEIAGHVQMIEKLKKQKELFVILDSEERLCSEKKHLEDELQSKTNQVEELFTALKKNESLAEENSINITKLKNELQVAEESDLDFERERAVQNRRQFEEVLSAISRTIYGRHFLFYLFLLFLFKMDISKQFGRKWLDDTEAVSCNGCKKAFSLMFRKHHCRMCGQIFCASCSSHTAEVASNKNPVRVCNLCYQEILSR
uniref:FYVE-type domain-containing protein n=1 Tax=Syphacia muris TaxID=451379 RepID=A0A0N5AZL5_9BILA